MCRGTLRKVPLCSSTESVGISVLLSRARDQIPFRVRNYIHSNARDYIHSSTRDNIHSSTRDYIPSSTRDYIHSSTRDYIHSSALGKIRSSTLLVSSPPRPAPPRHSNFEIVCQFSISIGCQCGI